MLAVVLIVLFFAAIVGLLSVFSVEDQSIIDLALSEIRQQQRNFSDLLGQGVRALGDDIGFDSVLYLIWICFLYGIFHALGPGHGKAVIASYTLTTDTKILLAVMLSMASSFVQGLTAILIVGTCYFLLETSVRSTSLAIEDVMESLSYGAVSIVGLVLIWRGVRGSSGDCCDHEHSEGGGEEHYHSCCEHHVSDHAHEHTKSDKAIQARDNLPHTKRDLIAIILAVGIRPCTGALLVLILAFVLGQWAGGLAAVLAMSFGTGITVSLLAIGARGIRFPLMKIMDEMGVHVGYFGRYVSLLGGIVIAIIGLLLLTDTLMTPQHPFA
ncbi:nickel/cobalt transporter [Kiloniella spongiae]|uniref:nickel/cobalt transporter n=1 Tax=Kiloniella spongiae TaxID=1489064 RepID=UPI000A9C076B|nr:high frequency lysogenization protein HflD [Kiloniella spongiae]